MLAKEDYAGRLESCKQVFKKVMEELFNNNKHFSKTLQLHSFVMKRVKNEESIYFDGKLLTEESVLRKSQESDESYIQRFLQNKESDKVLLKKSKSYIESGALCTMYWILLCDQFGSDCGTFILYLAFSQLAAGFTAYLENTAPLLDVEKIIELIENSTERYIQRMFAPFHFSLVNALSGEYYEKSECQANMIFLPYHSSDMLTTDDWVYRFEAIDFVPSKNRLLRKLLQIAQDKLYLALETDENAKLYRAIGICKKDILNKKVVDSEKNMIQCISVRIKAHMVWDMFLGDTYIMTCRNGHYKMKLSFDNAAVEKCLLNELSKYFGKEPEDYKELYRNINRSTKQPHGTMLVIMESADADSEAKRLGEKQYGLVAPVSETRTEDINHLNAIDGSIIMDTDGQIYGIGMILDGMSKKTEGDLSRGARYNSAVKYRDFLRDPSGDGKQEKIKGMILIVSEDGFYDIISA